MTPPDRVMALIIYLINLFHCTVRTVLAAICLYKIYIILSDSQVRVTLTNYQPKCYKMQIF